MAKLLKLRRGTTSQHSSFTGAEGECTVDMTKDTLVVHDGSTAGGHALARENLSNVSANTVRDLVENASNSNTFTDGDHSKLAGIESNATADQSNSEIKTAYEANSNTNAFTDTLLSKLNGIASSATNVTNNNQITNGRGFTTYTSNQATNTSSNVTFGTINCSSLTSSGNVTAYSDSRLKTDISTINDALGTVGKLRGVNYKWLRSGQSDIGVIAQEVEAVVPEVVKTTEVAGLDGMEEVKSVDYGRLVGVLINAINELKAEVDELKGGK